MNDDAAVPVLPEAPAKRASEAPSVVVSGCSASPVSIHNYPEGSPQLPKAPFPPQLTQATHEEWSWAKNLLAISESHERRVQFEAGWIGQRMTWLVVSQSFLFIAFALVASKTAVFQIPHKQSAADLVPPSASLDPQVTPILALLIASVALVQASFGFLSILAARRVNLRQAKLRGTIDGWIKDHAVPREFYDGWQSSVCKGRRLNDALGAAASWGIPLTLVGAWLGLLLYMTWSGFNVRTDAFSQWIINVK